MVYFLSQGVTRISSLGYYVQAFIFLVDSRQALVAGVEKVAGRQCLQVDRRQVGDVVVLHVDAVVLVDRLPPNNWNGSQFAFLRCFESWKWFWPKIMKGSSHRRLSKSRPLIGLSTFVDFSRYVASRHKINLALMRGQCIDLPLDSAPWLYSAAGPPTTANEQTIYLRCHWLFSRTC